MRAFRPRSATETWNQRPRTPWRSADREARKHNHETGGPLAQMIGLVLVTHGSLATEFVVAMEHVVRSEEHTYALQSLMRISYADFCMKKKKTNITQKLK